MFGNGQSGLGDREEDGEAGEVVDGVGLQGEGATMSGEDVAYEQETDALTLWLSRKERSEEMLCCFGENAASVVGDGKGGPPFVPRGGHGTLESYLQKYRGPLGGCMGGRCYAFNRVLYYIHQHLLEKDGVEANGDGIVGEMKVETDVGRKAETLEEGAAGLYLLAEVTEL